jgi:signal transduction histidine kinase
VRGFFGDRKLRLRSRFLVALLAVILVGETVVVVTFYNQQKQHGITEDLVSLGERMHHIADFQVGVVQLALQPSPVRPSQVNELRSVLRASEAAWLKASPPASRPDVRLLGPRVNALIHTRLHYDRVQNATLAQRREEGRVLVAEVRRIVAITKRVHGTVDAHIVAAQSRAKAEQSDAFRAVLIGSAVSLAAAIALALLLAQAITRPMARLAAGARELGAGRLDYRLDEGSNDEIGVVAAEFNHMANQLQEAHATMEERVQTRTRELADANHELDLNRAEQERLAQQRRMLLKRVINAQEDERQRIARELHDETGQALTALGLGLEAALGELRSGEQQSLAGRLQSLGHVASDAIEELNRLVLDLRPAQLDHLGLVATLRWYATRVHPEVETQLTVKGKPGRLQPEVETALFRIAQEALTNVARHAKASAVDVVLTFGPELVSLEVKDDGVGFDASASRAAPTSVGLIGMRERAQLVGGVIAVHSQPGEGTQISVTVPLERDDLDGSGQRPGRGEASDESRPLASEAMGAEIRRHDTEPEITESLPLRGEDQ